jgi:hypothetical protein
VPRALLGMLRQAPPAAGFDRFAGEVSNLVTDNFNNLDNLYGYSLVSGETNRGLHATSGRIPTRVHLRELLRLSRLLIPYE